MMAMTRSSPALPLVMLGLLVMAAAATTFVVQARQQTELERIARQADAKAASLLRKNLEVHEDVTRIQLADRAIRRGEIADARQLEADPQLDRSLGRARPATRRALGAGALQSTARHGTSRP